MSSEGFSKRVEPPEAPQAKIFEEELSNMSVTEVEVVEAVEVAVVVVVGEFLAVTRPAVVKCVGRLSYSSSFMNTLSSEYLPLNDESY